MKGVKGFYQGFNAGVATYAPYVGIYFVAYEKFKRMSMSYYDFPSELHLPFYHSLGLLYKSSFIFHHKLIMMVLDMISLIQ
jgi:hypothetical protein